MLSLELLGHCDTPSAVAYVVQVLDNTSRDDVSGAASCALESMSCSAAAFELWVRSDSFTRQLRARLNKISDRELTSLIRALPTYRKQRALERQSSRRYLERRGLAARLYREIDTKERILERLFEEGQPFSALGPELLDKISKRRLVAGFRSLDPFEVEAYRSDRKLLAYLKSRGIIATEILWAQVAETTEEPRRDYISRIAKKTGLKPKELGRLCGAWSEIEDLYQKFSILKSNGKHRTIVAPSPLLKRVQRRIYEKILRRNKLHPACHGFRPRRSIQTNARSHANRAVVINLDLRDFFPSVSAARVYGVFLSLGWTKDEARFLTRLCTYEGCLPQGAPTSPALANLVSRRLDSRLAGLARAQRARYTRYADDLTFSGPRETVACLPLIRQIICDEGFEVAEEKLRITGKGNRQEVTGLTVNRRVAVARHYRRRLRAAIHHLQTGKPVHWGSEPADTASIRGRIAFVTSIQPDFGKELMRQLEEALRDGSKR
jgi:retron-type reverse transcriptase